MKYIGNKQRLLHFIDNVIQKERVSGRTFCDIFTGTTSVAQFYKKKGYRLITNDIMQYSYVLQYAYIKNNKEPSFSGLLPALHQKSQNMTLLEKKPIEKVINYLNNIEPREGFIFNHYAPGGKRNKKYRRQYFTNYNAQMIDATRDLIQQWREKEKITEAEFFILLAAIIDEADYLANMSGTYGAYLKIWRSVALNKFELKLPRLINSDSNHKIYKKDANSLIKEISCDILYLDPPYNTRQYASNYHILETIAEWDNPKIYGKTGLRPYKHQKSLYSMKSKCTQAFEDLIDKAKARYILMSYNDEGIIPQKQILRILGKKGTPKVYKRDYRRFRTESDNENRHYKRPDDKVIEYVYFVKKE